MKKIRVLYITKNFMPQVGGGLRRIEAVYNLLKNKFGVLLPRVIVGDTEYEDVQTYQISPLQTPGYIGSTEENLEMFSFNLTITTT